METVEKCDAFASLDPMTCQRKMQGTDWLILFKQQQTSLFLHRLNQHSADWEFPMTRSIAFSFIKNFLQLVVFSLCVNRLQKNILKRFTSSLRPNLPLHRVQVSLDGIHITFR